MGKTRKGVFCLEGEWDSDMRKRSSVEPLLQLIRSEQGHPYIFRDVGTLEELHFFLRRWLQYRSYRILYLAFHGKPQKICLGDKEVDLDSLESELSGCCKDRVIVFASCSTLDLHGNRLNGFLKATGALAVCGYCKDVPWMESAVFELLLLSTMLSLSTSRRGLRAMEDKIHSQCPGLAKRLGFRMAVG